jgi:hypothetical protein
VREPANCSGFLGCQQKLRRRLQKDASICMSRGCAWHKREIELSLRRLKRFAEQLAVLLELCPRESRVQFPASVRSAWMVCRTPLAWMCSTRCLAPSVRFSAAAQPRLEASSKACRDRPCHKELKCRQRYADFKAKLRCHTGSAMSLALCQPVDQRPFDIEMQPRHPLVPPAYWNSAGP